MLEGWLATYYLLWGLLEEPRALYGINWEEQETEELITFVRQAMQEVNRRGIPLRPQKRVRITRTYRVFIDSTELKVRPLTKSILLLFLKHPEGIPLKEITSYREELAHFYRRVSKCSEPDEIETRINRIMDLFNNDLNVHIARVNRAIASLVDSASDYYQIAGVAGTPKRIPLDRKWVIWE